MIKRFLGEFPTAIFGTNAPQFDIAAWKWSTLEAVAADTDGIIDGGACSGTVAVTLTPDDGAAMPCARNVTATVACETAANIDAVKVKIYGTNIADEAIDEELAAFTDNTPGAVTGAKAFKTITSVVIPAMDGADVTVDIGWGDILGMPVVFDHNSVLYATLNHVRQTTAPTVMYSSTAVESNTIDLDSALDGTEVEAYFVI